MLRDPNATFADSRSETARDFPLQPFGKLGTPEIRRIISRREVCNRSEGEGRLRDEASRNDYNLSLTRHAAIALAIAIGKWLMMNYQICYLARARFSTRETIIRRAGSFNVHNRGG